MPFSFGLGVGVFGPEDTGGCGVGAHTVGDVLAFNGWVVTSNRCCCNNIAKINTIIIRPNDVINNMEFTKRFISISKS
jgi:hypothetical protein